MRLIPSKRQWSGWTLPSKLTTICAYLTIMMFCIFAISELVGLISRRSAPVDLVDLPNSKEYYKELGQGLLSFSYTENDIALHHFDKALGLAPKEDIRDLHLWRSFCYSANNQHEEAYKVQMEYYRDLANASTDEELEHLAILKLTTLFNQNLFDSMAICAEELISGGAVRSLKEIKPLALLGCNDYSGVTEDLHRKKYTVAHDRYFRERQYNIWSLFSRHFDSDSTRLEYFLSLMFKRSAKPQEFDKEYFCSMFPIGNVPVQSLETRELYQSTYNDVLSYTIHSKSSLWYMYRKELLEFGLGIGSEKALEIFLSDVGKDAHLLLSRMKAERKPEETDILYCPKSIEDGILILWISAKPDSILQSTLGKRYLGEVKVKMAKLSREQVQVAQIDSLLCGFGCYWLYAVPLENNLFDYILFSTAGSGTYLDIEAYSAEDLDVVNSDAIEELFEMSYHAQNAHVMKDSRDIKLIWLFELHSPCQTNATRKVFGECTYKLKYDGQMEGPWIRYQNPALEFFMELSSQNVKLQTLLLEKLSIQGKVIKDIEFRDNLARRNDPCFIITAIDRVYRFSPGVRQPRISCLSVHYASPEEPLFEYQVDSLDYSDSSADYIFLVKRQKEKTEVLDIFSVKNNRIIKSVIYD